MRLNNKQQQFKERVKLKNIHEERAERQNKNKHL
jgi:hypothetical protein